MTELTTILVPESQRANALAGFLGLEEQPTKEIDIHLDGSECADGAMGCRRLNHVRGRVPLVAGDKVRFVTEEETCDAPLPEGAGSRRCQQRKGHHNHHAYEVTADIWAWWYEDVRPIRYATPPHGFMKAADLVPLLRDGQPGQPVEGEVDAIEHDATGALRRRLGLPDDRNPWVLLWKEKG